MEPQSSQAPLASAASLPPVAPTGALPKVPQPQALVPAPQQQPAVPQPDIKLQARQLVEQYKNDPYMLSVEFTRLKAAHIARQFHVVENTVEN